LRKVLDNVINLTEIRLETDSAIKFTTHLDAYLPEKVYGDAYKLTEILTVLLYNAAEFTQKGKIDFTVTLVQQVDKVC